MAFKIIDKPCEECGKIMYGVCSTSKYCDGCKAIRKRNCRKKSSDSKQIIKKEIDIIKYKENFKLISTDIKNLIPYNFNKISKLRVKSYTCFHKCNWIDVIKAYGDYDRFYDLLKEMYIDYFKKTSKRDLLCFAKEYNMTYEIFEQIGVETFMSDCNIQRFRYENKDYENNFKDIVNTLGRAPLYDEFDKMTKISLVSYGARYNLKGNGKYNSLVKLMVNEEQNNEYLKNQKQYKANIGKQNTLESSLKNKIPEEELEFEFRKVFDATYEKYKKYPTRKYFDQFAKHDSSVYRTRFDMCWTDICNKKYNYVVDRRGSFQATVTLKNIQEILKSEYTPEKTWDWLIGNGGKHMFCDGYFEEFNLVIEYDGRQHRMPIAKFGGLPKFLELKENDTLKDKLLEEHCINIIRIDSRGKWFNIDYLRNKLIKNPIIKNILNTQSPKAS